MKDDRHWLQKFVQDNLWSILALIVAMSIFYANINSRVSAAEDKVIENGAKLDAMQILVERVIRLEEHDNNIESDIMEIKQDLKEIKQLVR